MFKKILALSLVISSQYSYANICGTDYQNFAPLTSGLDFISVHSSETLEPCLGNLGFFYNYSQNTLSYVFEKIGRENKVKDSMSSVDLNIGFGLTERWDFGVSLPFSVASSIDDTDYASYLENDGMTEVRVNTKYRLFGDKDGGFALAGTLNSNTIENNPFVGTNAGPTIGIDLIADTMMNEIGLAANIGYRFRQPGDAIPGVPIEPLGNQLTYSAAMSFWLESFDTRVVAEVMGAQLVENTENTVSDAPSLEALLGFKQDYSNDMSFHLGMGSALQKGIASPEFRFYAGFNWTFGHTLCAPTQKNDLIAEVTQEEAKQIEQLPPPEPQVIVKTVYIEKPVQPRQQKIKLSAEVLFDFDSDVIKPEAKVHLDRINRIIGQSKYKVVQIFGHTDSIGSDEYNMKLSVRRAEAVKKYLNTVFSIDLAKLESAGKGEREPVADNRNAQGRLANRRVEFIIHRE